MSKLSVSFKVSIGHKRLICKPLIKGSKNYLNEIVNELKNRFYKSELEKFAEVMKYITDQLIE